MQFHEKKIDLFDFTSFFLAWTFLNFLACCVVFQNIIISNYIPGGKDPPLEEFPEAIAPPSDEFC